MKNRNLVTYGGGYTSRPVTTARVCANDNEDLATLLADLTGRVEQLEKAIGLDQKDPAAPDVMDVDDPSANQIYNGRLVSWRRH